MEVIFNDEKIDFDVLKYNLIIEKDNFKKIEKKPEKLENFCFNGEWLFIPIENKVIINDNKIKIQYIKENYIDETRFNQYVTDMIRIYLDYNTITKGVLNKKHIIICLLDFITETKKFLEISNKFKLTVFRKLIELTIVENHNCFEEYFEKIFGIYFNEYKLKIIHENDEWTIDEILNFYLQ